MIDEFTKQYIITALWASDDQKGDPLRWTYGSDDLPPETLAIMVADCEQFQEQTAGMIEHDLSGAGHNFWLTRNGHGAGFWDGDWPEHGDILTIIASACGKRHLYVNKGLIYQE